MRLSRLFTIILILYFFGPLTLSAQADSSVSWGLSVSPQLLVPVGQSADVFRLGYGANLTTLLVPNQLPWLSPRLDLSYNYIPLTTTLNHSASVIDASIGMQATATFGERFRLYGYGTFGGYFGILAETDPETVWNLSFHTGGGLSLQLFKDVSFSLGAEYLARYRSMYGISVFLSVNTRLAGSGGGPIPVRTISPLRSGGSPVSGYLKISQIEVDAVFPVLRKYYDSHPIGTAVVENTGDQVLENVELRVVPSRYIDSPKLSARIDSMRPGETATLDLYVLFNEEILSESEGGPIVTDIAVTYRVGQRAGSDIETFTLQSHNRNALQWDDDEKIAAFVTAKDDEIQRFARNMASTAQDVRIDAVNAELQLGMLLFTSMTEQGLTYVIDPSSSYEELSENPAAIDYVQFPRQTLYVKAGDCDDLSATYCALLEAVGINTAFITVPGHIFTAFRVNIDADQMKSAFSDTEDFLVLDDGTVWIPVETTMLDKGFLEAWTVGARQWKRHDSDGNASLIPVSEAWGNYAPVAFGISTIELGMPERSSVSDRFSEELQAFVAREIYPQEQALLTRLDNQPGNPVVLNRLGVLYARFGLYLQARARFLESIGRTEYVPALVNLGNLDFLAGNLGDARNYYQQVLRTNDTNLAALLGLARVEYDLENFGSARTTFEKLAALAPALAERYSYLGSRDAQSEAERASDYTMLQSGAIWEVE